MYKIFTAIVCGMHSCISSKFLTVMKLAIVLWVVTILQVNAASYAQKISLKVTNKPLVEVLDQISQQTNCSFLYNSTILKTAKPVSFSVVDKSLNEVLEICFKDQPLTYVLNANTVVIKSPRGVATPTAQIDNVTVNGTVTDDAGRPLVGVTVLLKGTAIGIATDAKGKFALNLPDKAGILVFSLMGFTPVEIPVVGQTVFNVSLKEKPSALNDVIVTGYTSQRKKDIAGSVAIIDLSAARNLPSNSTEQLLQGQAAGVTVVTQGAPGAGSYVFVRGISNFQNSQPLYVIDGVQGGSMSNISPNDIESIQVLKDAGAASIYGVSGGNGVVIITTKRGKQGKTVFTYDAYYGMQIPKGGNVFDKLSPSEMSTLTYQVGDLTTSKQIYPGGAGTLPVYAYQGPGVAGVGNANYDLSQYHFDASNPANNFLIQKFNQGGTDWFHALFKASPIQYHTFSASGASNKNSYFFSLGYLNDQGTEIKTYQKRYETRINTVFSLTPHIRVGENAFVYYKVLPQDGFANQNQGDPILNSALILPQIPVYDIAGNYGGVYASTGSLPLGSASNPVATQNMLKNQYFKTWNIQGNVFAEVDFLKHFTAKTMIAGNIGNNYGYGYSTFYYQDSHPLNPNTVYENAQYSSQYNWTNTVQYKQLFQKHSVSLLAGYEQRHTEGRAVDASGTNLYSTDPNYADVSNATTNILAHSYPFQPTSTVSIFGKLDYIYNNKYILDATIRRDGFSAFYPGKQFGNFPSVSLAWRISQEGFLKTINWINDLKLRASYGIAGNNSNVPGANAYSFFSSSFDNGYYAINGGNRTVQGFYNSNIGNQNTTWETDKILNFGIDATLFNHLDLNLEIYKKSISGLLFQEPLPSIIGGGNAPYINLGNVENKGFDIAATYHGGGSRDFRYNIGVNITAYRNKISSLPGKYFDETTSQVNDITREELGHPIGSFFGYKVTGFYSPADIANNAVPKYVGAVAGAFKYADLNGDGIINDSDRGFIGNPNPQFTYGVNLNASYKHFDFTMILYGSQGNKDFDLNKFFTDFYQSGPTAKSKGVLYSSYGAPGVTNPTLPIQTDNNPMGTTQISSFYVQNGSFLKCRVAQLGYSFSSDLFKKMNISKLHVYIQATNLFTITKYTGLDPELPPVSGNALGVDLGNYPSNQKQFILGLNLAF